MSNPRTRIISEHGSLAEWLRALPDDKLVRLLALRPDLATPPPPDFDILAARLDVRGSVTRALERLDTFTLEIIQALTVLPAPTTADRLRACCGGVDPRVPLTTLRERGLVWGDDDAIHLVGMAVDLLGDRPLGLGRPLRTCLAGHSPTRLARIAAAVGLAESDDPAADSAVPTRAGPPRPSGFTGSPTRRDAVLNRLSAAFADPDRLARLVDGCSPRARQVLERLAAGPALGSTAEADRLLSVSAARTPVEELLARGLLVGVDGETVELPREVGLLLRGATPAGVLHSEPPAMIGTDVGDAADPSAALEADALVRSVMTLLSAWGTTPAVPLRGGGLSVRDLKATARLLDVSEPVAAVIVEAAAAAGLLDTTPGAEARYVPTSAFDRWSAESVAMRWATVVEGWLGSTSVAAMVGGRDERGRQIAALSLDVRRSAAPELRAEVLRAIAAAPEGTAPSPESVRALLTWRAPRRGGPLLETMIDGTLVEAELMGLTGRGAPSTVARLLARALDAERGEQGRRGEHSGPPARPADGAASLRNVLADAMLPLLPDPVEKLLIQGDLTAVAPGPLVPRLAAELTRIADVESAGAATVYRFSEASLRRGLDSGLSAEDIHAMLERLARSGVPQALTYLIDDTARRHGRLRAGTAASYLRCDDPTLLSEVIVSRRTQGLGLRRIAPSIVISSSPVPDLLEGLRAAGFAPMAEAADGRIMISRPEVHRAPGRPRPSRRDLSPDRTTQLGDVVRLVRRGDEMARAARAAGSAVEARMGLVRSAPLILVMVQGAVRDQRRVLLGYVDQQGMPSDRVVRPTALEGGWLTAWDERSGAVRRFALHRVTGVADIDDSLGGPPNVDVADWVLPPPAADDDSTGEDLTADDTADPP